MKTLLRVRRLGVKDYLSCWQEMRAFTDQRNSATADEIWVLQHPPVYTRGISCKAKPCFGGVPIPVIDSDRGGQMTYHGPGQPIFYFLLDLKRLGVGPKSLVGIIEQAVIELLKDFSITAQRRSGAPGVYVKQGKIAALGLRLRKGCCYHGLSFNVNLDLAPYRYIDPCGYRGLAVTRLCDLIDDVELTQVESELAANILKQLDLNTTTQYRRL